MLTSVIEESRQKGKGKSKLSHQHLLPIVSTLASEIVPNLVRELGRVKQGETPYGSNRARMANVCQHESAQSSAALSLRELAKQCVQACLDMDVAQLTAWSEKLISEGLDIEVFYLDVIPQAIRSLHDLWEEDQVSFLDVTRATWHVKRLLFALSPQFIQPASQTFIPQLNRFQAIVCTSPGSQHTLGPLLVSQFLQRKGWLVVPGIEHSEKEVLETVKKNWVDLFCVSISVSSEIPRLKSWIRRVRAQSKNIYIQCMVGGALLELEPDLVSRLGADAACANPRVLHNLGVKLVKVHRKVRKLNFQSVEELSQGQWLDNQQDLKKDDARFNANFKNVESASSLKMTKSSFSSPESSNSASFNPKASTQRAKSARGLKL